MWPHFPFSLFLFLQDHTYPLFPLNKGESTVCVPMDSGLDALEVLTGLVNLEGFSCFGDFSAVLPLDEERDMFC